MSRTTNIRNKTPLGIVIATALKNQNKTQRWLAEKTGISFAYIWMITVGNSVPSIKFLEKISNVLQIDINDLISAILKD